jgi:hypothetical protein
MHVRAKIREVNSERKLISFFFNFFFLIIENFFFNYKKNLIFMYIYSFLINSNF